MASITVTVAPFFHGSHRIQILHRNISLQIQCNAMRIQFGLSTQIFDHTGKLRLSFVVDENSLNLCNILDAYDNIAKRFVNSDSNLEWRSVVSRKSVFSTHPLLDCTYRLKQELVRDVLRRSTTRNHHRRLLSNRLFPVGVNFSMDKDKSKREKNSKKGSISGFVNTNDNPNRRSNLRILLCDTNVESCHEIFSLLRQCNYQVTQAITLVEMKDALILEGSYTDIILCEVNLLLLNNGELLKAITENTMLQHIPVIMILTEDQVPLTLNGLELGAADYVMSPVSANELINLWTHILARS